MKGLLILFLSLCFLLLRSGEYSHYRKHHDHSVYAPAQELKQTQRHKVPAAPGSQAVLHHSSVAHDTYNVIDTEEDEDFLFAPPFILLAGFFFTLAHVLFLSDSGRSKQRHFLHRCVLASGNGIYLTQRSLRI